MQQTICGRGKSFAGAALAAIGVFIINADLDRAATQLSHLLSAIPTESLGVWPTVILAASRVLQANAIDYQQFLQGFLQHMLVSSWALLLVTAGTVRNGNVAGCLRRERQRASQRKILDLSI